MRRLLLCLSALLILPSMALAQFGYRIVGGMSNFDVYNHCDHPCDEFEIEIEDCRPEDVIHVYHNGNYGGPTITRAPNGTSCIIDYRNPAHLTAVGTLEHFGIVLRQLTPTNNVHVRWMRGGAPATVNGQVPNPSGGTTAKPHALVNLLGSAAIGQNLSLSHPPLIGWARFQPGSRERRPTSECAVRFRGVEFHFGADRRPRSRAFSSFPSENPAGTVESPAMWGAVAAIQRICQHRRVESVDNPLVPGD